MRGPSRDQHGAAPLLSLLHLSLPGYDLQVIEGQAAELFRFRETRVCASSPARHSWQQYCDAKLPLRSRATIEWRMPMGRLSRWRTWHPINLHLLQRHN
jgi:hypothetical protein